VEGVITEADKDHFANFCILAAECQVPDFTARETRMTHQVHSTAGGRSVGEDWVQSRGDAILEETPQHHVSNAKGGKKWTTKRYIWQNLDLT
jgi:hypothetical protein